MNAPTIRFCVEPGTPPRKIRLRSRFGARPMNYATRYWFFTALMLGAIAVALRALFASDVRLLCIAVILVAVGLLFARRKP